MCDEMFKSLGKEGLYDYQRNLLTSLNKDSVIINKSRQIGISYFFAAYSLIWAVKGKTALIVSPSERQSKHFLSYSKQFLNEAKNKIERSQEHYLDLVEETKTSLIFSNGGMLVSLPNSPNTVRGYTADIVIFDEYAHFLNNTDKEIMEAVLPSLSRRGKLVIISTPFGEGNEFYNAWMQKKGYEKVLINYKDCPDINVEKIRDKLDIDGFEQEYNNRFLGDTTSEFSFKLIKSCINTELQYDPSPSKAEELYMGMDVGRHKHLSVVAIIEKKDEKLILRDLITWRSMKFTEQENNLIDLLERYKIKNFNIDKGGLGMDMSESLQDRFPEIVNPFDFTNKSKQALVTYTKKLFEDKKIEIPDDAFLINSIHQISRKKSQSTGYVTYDAEESKETGHADAFWALALAALGTKEGKTFDFEMLEM